MTDKYEAESKFLRKNYHVFLYEYMIAVNTGTDPMHLHPPPAFRALYELIVRRFAPTDSDDITMTDLAIMMDMVAKFMIHLHRNGIEYDNFTACRCTRLTDEDLDLLLQSGKELM